MQQVKDRKPLKISTSAPGKLLQKSWQETSQRTKILALVGILGGATLLTALIQAGTEDYRAIAPHNPNASANLIVDPPMSGVTADADAYTVMQHLTARLPEYEAYLVDTSDATLTPLVNVEAMRLYEQARKESSSGKYNPVDPTGTLDLANCPARLDMWRCVLLRYSTEGLMMIAQGLETNNAMLYSNGRIRFTAALMAQYPVPVVVSDRSSVLHAHRNYLSGLYEMLQLLPSGKSPIQITAPVDPAVQSPLGNIQSNNPSEVN